MLTTCSHRVAEVVANAMRQEKDKVSKGKKGKIQIPLFAEHIIVYVLNMTEPT